MLILDRSDQVTAINPLMSILPRNCFPELQRCHTCIGYALEYIMVIFPDYFCFSWTENNPGALFSVSFHLNTLVKHLSKLWNLPYQIPRIEAIPFSQ